MLEAAFCTTVAVLYYLVAHEHKAKEPKEPLSRAVLFYVLLGHIHLGYGLVCLIVALT